MEKILVLNFLEVEFPKKYLQKSFKKSFKNLLKIVKGNFRKIFKKSSKDKNFFFEKIPFKMKRRFLPEKFLGKTVA